MQWPVGARASRLLIALGVVAIVADVAAWGVRCHERAALARLHDGMTFEELQARYGRPVWSVGKNVDLEVLAHGLRFASTPLVGRCLSPTMVGGATATADELPWILSPRTARQIWLFRTGWVTGILVYPGDDYRARCILRARPSGWSALLAD